MNNLIYSRAVAPYLNGWRLQLMGSWQKSTLHTKIKAFKNCLLSLQKLKKDSLNKKSNCLFGEAMLVKVLSFFAWIKIYQ